MDVDLRHPAGHRWLVVCEPTDGSGEWIIDGAPDQTEAARKLEAWQDRSDNEWGGQLNFRLAEATG